MSRLGVSNSNVFSMLCLLLMILFIGCENSGKQNIKEIHTYFKIQDTVVFQLDSATSSVTKAMYYHYENDKPYLIYLDELSNTVQAFNLTTKKKEYSIPIMSIGKNAIPGNLGFAIKSFDSIYIASLSGELIHVNNKGEIIRRYNYNNFREVFLPIVSISRYYTPLIFHKQNIYGMQSNGNPHYINEAIADYKFCAKINVVTGVSEIMPIHHHDKFWKDGIKQTFLSWDYNGDYFVFSPVYSHEIYLSKMNKQIDATYIVKSKYVDDFYMFNPNFHDNQYFNKLLINQEYFAIKYDKFRDVYYRFFWQGISEEHVLESSNIFDLYQNVPTFGIMVLDNNFKLIDEIILPKNIYSQHKFFVGEEGLYLSADHKNNENSNENEWCFHVYTIENVVLD